MRDEIDVVRFGFKRKRPELNRLDELIARAKEYSNRANLTFTGQLCQLRDEAETLLFDLVREFGTGAIDIASSAREALGEIASVNFALTADEAKLAQHQEHIYDELARLADALVSVRHRIHRGVVAHPPKSQMTPPKRSGSDYSPQDDKRYQHIGYDQIARLTNAELWKRYKREEHGKHPGLTYHAFRVSLNRIRNRHALPSSKEVRKK